jgi:hypothetical protein
MEGNSGRPPFAPPQDPRQRRQQQYQQPYEFGTAGSKGRNYSASPPPPLPYQQSTPTTINQHMRTHSRSFSGTLSPPHVPYRVSVSGAGHVDEINSDQEEEEREAEEEEEEQVVRSGGGGTLPIHINASPPQVRGGYPLRGRQSPRSPPPLSTMFGSRVSPKSPSSPSRLSSSPSTSTTPNYPSNASINAKANTVAMPILTREQINQIESETEERLMRIRMGVDVGGLPLPPSPGVLGVSRGGGFNSDSDDLIGGGGGSGFAMGMGPRRSSSAGLTSTRSSPGTPRFNPGTNTSASPSTAGSSTSTSASSVSTARPASIMLGKSSPFPPSSERERERRVLRKRSSDLGAKVKTESSLATKGSTAPSTPTTAHTIPGSSTADIIGTGSPGNKHIHGQMQKPKLSLSGLLSSPSSSAGGGGRTSPSLDAQSPTFPRYAPSVMRSPTTPTATGNTNARSFSGINSPPSNTNAYTTPSSSNSANPNASINPQIQPSHPSAHGHGHGTMASAKALLRRVRSGSSLRPGMGVHPEEETDGVESLGSVAGATVLGDGRNERGSGGRSKGAMMERIARGWDSGI